MKPIHYDKMIIVGDRVGDLEVVESPKKLQPLGRYGEWFVKVKCKCGSIKNVSCVKWRRKKVKRCRACQLIGSGNYAWNGYGELSGHHYSTIKQNAKSRNLEMNISKKALWEMFLSQNRKCAISGMPIQFTINKSEKTASLDRIDSSKGYIKGNVQWIHKDVNLMKNHFSQEYFVQICESVYEHNKSRNK